MQYQNLKWRRWTLAAVECYLRNMKCEAIDKLPHTCIYKEVLEQQCMMKGAVINLVRDCGKPPKEMIKEVEECINARYY